MLAVFRHAKYRVVFDSSTQRIEEAIPKATLDFHHVAEVVAIGGFTCR